MTKKKRCQESWLKDPLCIEYHGREGGSLGRYICHFPDGKNIWIDPSTKRNALSDENLRSSEETRCCILRLHCGLQAAGIINFHEKDCFVCKELMK